MAALDLLGPMAESRFDFSDAYTSNGSEAKVLGTPTSSLVEVVQ